MFYLAVKSTVDRQAYLLAQSMGITSYLDLDDVTNVEEMMASTQSVLLWQLLSFTEEPRDPLFSMVMGFGVKTSVDPSNYKMSTFISQIRAQMPVGTTIPVRDFSVAEGQDPGPVIGSICISNSSVRPQEMDFNSGIRMYTVEAYLCRYSGAGV